MAIILLASVFFTENYGNKIIRVITKKVDFLENPACFKDNELMTKYGGSLFIANKNQSNIVDKELKYAQSVSANVFEIDKKSVLNMVPIIKEEYLDRAIHEPDSKVMDVDLIHQGFARGLKENNGKILFNEEAKEITKKNGLWNVITKNNKFISPILINAAGAWCDEVSILAGCNPLNLSPKRRTVVIFENSSNLNITMAGCNRHRR